MSTKTKQPYIDKNGACFMMNSTAEASEFVKIRSNTYADELKYYKNIRTLVDSFYQQGIKKINVKLKERDSFIIYEIQDDDIKQNHYHNHEANFLLARFKETDEKKYLEKLKECLLLTPVALPRRLEGEHQEIKYCILKRAGKKYYLMFTTLQEFNQWSGTQILEFFPLEINFLKGERIRKTDGVVINPLSTRLLLEDENIKALK